MSDAKQAKPAPKLTPCKPCPFCCSTSLSFYMCGPFNQNVAIRCQTCGSVGPTTAEKEPSIQAWNRRPRRRRG